MSRWLRTVLVAQRGTTQYSEGAFNVMTDWYINVVIGKSHNTLYMNTGNQLVIFSMTDCDQTPLNIITHAL